MNRHQRRRWVAQAVKLARVEGNELFVGPHKIADLNPKHKHHGISTKQLLTEWATKQEGTTDV